MVAYRRWVLTRACTILGQFFFTYGNCTAETYPCFTFFLSYEKSLSRKNKALPIENFPSLVLSRNVIMLQFFIIQFLLCYLPSGLPWEVKNKKKTKELKLIKALKWSLTRGFKYSDFTWNLLVFCHNGCWGEVVTTWGMTVTIHSK